LKVGKAHLKAGKYWVSKEGGAEGGWVWCGRVGEPCAADGCGERETGWRQGAAAGCSPGGLCRPKTVVLRCGVPGCNTLMQALSSASAGYFVSQEGRDSNSQEGRATAGYFVS
jgi:hypothetical protein